MSPKLPVSAATREQGPPAAQLSPAASCSQMPAWLLNPCSPSCAPACTTKPPTSSSKRKQDLTPLRAVKYLHVGLKQKGRGEENSHGREVFSPFTHGSANAEKSGGLSKVLEFIHCRAFHAPDAPEDGLSQGLSFGLLAQKQVASLSLCPREAGATSAVSSSGKRP